MPVYRFYVMYRDRYKYEWSGPIFMALVNWDVWWYHVFMMRMINFILPGFAVLFALLILLVWLLIIEESNKMGGF